MFKISIISIGDEICIGQIVNTNSAWLAARCTELGAEVVAHSTIGDDICVINSEISRLFSHSDLLLLTGGLGPTHDDMTKPALCELFKDYLVLHEPTLKNIVERFRKRGIPMSERNRAQAELPSKCIPLKNTAGTAPGMFFKETFNGYTKNLISLPGVPKEMTTIMENEGLLLIKKLIADSGSEITAYKTLHTTGIAESVLADLIGGAEQFLNGATLAFLPSYYGVRLRIGKKAGSAQLAENDIAEIERIIRERAGKYVIGEGNETLISIVGNQLRYFGKTVSTAESCTGGMLGAAFTEISGSSEFFIGGAVVYSNESKCEFLNVKCETIENYGAVSEQTAIELAIGARNKFKTDFALSITGIAGPSGGTPEKPVGTVYIGIADEMGAEARVYSFSDNRAINRERAVGAALALLLEKLLLISKH